MVHLINKPDVELVIARYNEDIAWVKMVPNCTHIVYNKGHDSVAGQVWEVGLPNIGREAHTYLYHIVQNYDVLADYTVFLQGNPTIGLNRHVMDLAKVIDDRSFIPYAGAVLNNLDGSPSHFGLQIEGRIFKPYFINYPNKVMFPVGAQFMVASQVIRNRTKKFYQLLLEECNRNKQFPWEIERAWPYIFNPEYRTIHDTCTTI